MSNQVIDLDAFSVMENEDSMGVGVEMEDLNDAKAMTGESERNLTDDEIVDTLLAKSSDEENDSSDDLCTKAHATSRVSPAEEGASDHSSPSTPPGTPGSPIVQMDAPNIPLTPQDVEMLGSSSGKICT